MRNFFEGSRTVANTMLTWLQQNRDFLRRLGLLVGVLTMLVGLYLALASAPDLIRRLYLLPYAVLVLVAVPIATIVNTVEFRLITAMGQRHVGWLAAFEVSIIASAANMLPVPGGAITRTAAMRSYGISTKLAASLVLSLLVSWAAAAFLYSGAWILSFGHYLIGGSFILLGLVLLIASVVHLLLVKVTWQQIVASLLVRAAGLTLEAIRLMLVGASLGITLGFDQASIFSTGAVVGSAVSIVPSGLGATEAVMAALSPLAKITPAAGFLIAVANRISVIIGLLLLVSIVALLRVQRRHKYH